MFSIKALENLDARGRTAGAYLRYASECLDEAAANAVAKRDLLRAIRRFVVWSHGVTLAVLVGIYVPDHPAGYVRLAVFEGVSCALLIALVFLTAGLLRNSQGVSRESLGLANRLTLTRLALVAPIVLLIVDCHPRAALAFYGVCAATDIADGMIARRQADKTLFGTVMDPAADIFSTAAAYTAFYAVGWVPGWVLGILYVRYGTLFAGSTALFFSVGPYEVKATWVGKIAAVLQGAAAALIIAWAPGGGMAYERLGEFLFPFLGVVFGSVIVSQLVIGSRHIRKGAVHARGSRGTSQRV
jgi:phosphatidylglycerophosphate synthase